MRTFLGFQVEHEVIECECGDFEMDDDDHVGDDYICLNCGGITLIRSSFQAHCSEGCGLVHFDSYDDIEILCECGEDGCPVTAEEAAEIKAGE